MSNRHNNFYEFGEFRFDPRTKVLWRRNETLPLPPKATDVLAMLIADHGDLVERERLLHSVWRDTFVEEGNLNNAISSLRKIFGEDEIIQTVPRRGYRFTAAVKECLDEVDALVLERQTTSHTFIEEREIVSEDAPRHVGELTGAVAKTNRSYLPLASVGGAVIALAVVGWFYFGNATAGSEAQRSAIGSVAVLPLRSFSNDSANEELRLRITDALITKLGSFDKLVIRPTNSVLRYSSQDRDAIAAGKQLGVDTVLDGRLQEEDGRLRVTLQLVSVNSGDQLWSEQFDGRSGEILALQDAISNRLRRDFAFVDTAEFKRRPPNSNEAYEAYLKGRFLWNQRKRESYFTALEYFQKSIEADPNFALAYTGISDSYHLLQQRNVLSTIEAFEKAETAARKALELDPESAEANTSMGSVSFIRYSRWGEAEKYYQRAIELNPNAAEPYARMGMLLNAWGRFDEAHAVLKKAESLDPTSVNNAIYLGANYYFSKQFDRAEVQFNKILEFAPGTERAHFFLARINEIGGRYEDAMEHHLKEREISNPDSVALLREAYQTGGIRTFWRKQIDLMKEELKKMHGLENHIASRYVLLGETSPACEYIGQNLEVRGSMQNYGRVDPIFDPIRTDPQFRELMKRWEPEV